MNNDQLTLDGSKYRVARGRQAGMSTRAMYDGDKALGARLPSHPFGYAPDIMARARARGVHPSEIKALRDDYHGPAHRGDSRLTRVRVTFHGSPFGLLASDADEFYAGVALGAVHVIEPVSVVDG